MCVCSVVFRKLFNGSLALGREPKGFGALAIKIMRRTDQKPMLNQRNDFQGAIVEYDRVPPRIGESTENRYLRCVKAIIFGPFVFVYLVAKLLILRLKICILSLKIRILRRKFRFLRRHYVESLLERDYLSAKIGAYGNVGEQID